MFSDFSTWLWVGSFILSVLLVGLFSGLETSLYVLNKIRIELMANTGSVKAKFLTKLLNRPNRLLSVLLLGTNIFSYLATFAVSVLVIASGVGEHMVEFYTIAITTPILFAFCDSVPKNVSRRSAQRFAMRFLPLLKLFDYIFTYTGLSGILQLASGLWVKLLVRKKDRASVGLGYIVEEGHASGAISKLQSAMANRVMAISHVHIGQVMQTLNNVQSITEKTTRDELLEIIREGSFSRLPVVVGKHKFNWIIDIYDVLADRQDKPIQEFFTQPMYVHAAETVPETLFAMQRNRKHIAVVVGKKGRHVGIVTIKDLVQEIAGDIADW